MINRLALFLAQGLGIGCVPSAPGTWGSVLGIVFFLLLLLPGQLSFLLIAIVVSTGLSVWCCGVAEKVLGKTDPGSVVLDEVIALPICFLSWVLWRLSHGEPFPTASYFLSQWPWLIVVFILFRLFDIIKPWPVFQIQHLPGGWGITADDVLAGGYVSLVMLIPLWLGWLQ
jgi:phosphatidylglycerophosphatase A